MQLATIASSSSGNCIYVGDENTHVLIDAGISKKRIEQGLCEHGINPKDLDGILITHEHSDHISGLGVLTRKYPMPIYGTKDTLNYLKKSTKLGCVDEKLMIEIKPDLILKINTLNIKPFKISHDALDPVGYRLESGNKSVAIATDLGTFSDYTISNLTNLDALVLEANHDIRMLQVGSYPYYLKQRILGNCGHLSNEASGKLLSKLLNNNLKKVFLGHLSRENNYDKLAYETVKSEIDMDDTLYKSKDFDIEVANRDITSDLIVI